MKNVTIYTLAEELGMTPSMVSRAFNPDAMVAKKKRELILETARKYNFEPNKFAARMTGKTIRIGVIIYHAAEHIRQQLICGIENAYNNLKDYKIEYKLKCFRIDESTIDSIEADLNEFEDYDGVITVDSGIDGIETVYDNFIKKNPNLVFVQSMRKSTEYLFASLHDTFLASELGAEILGDRLYCSDRKNILMFVSNLDQFAESGKMKVFEDACKKNGLNVLECVNMGDSEEYLSSCVDSILEKYSDKVDGVFITSGNSVPLCEAIKRMERKPSLVTFDIYPRLSPYIEDRTICSTIFQNVSAQAEKAFTGLVEYLVHDKVPEKIVYTNLVPVSKSTLHQYNMDRNVFETE